MWNDDIVCVLIKFGKQQIPEKCEVVIINVKVDGCKIRKRRNNRIVDDLFVYAKFIEKQKDLQFLIDVSALYIESLARHRTENAHAFEVLVTFLRSVA